MAFVIDVPAQPVYIEQAPPPVVLQAAPPPVIIEQAPPPVVFQAAPPPVIIEQAPPPVVFQAAPPPVIIEQAPPPVVVQGPVVITSPMRSTPTQTRCRFCQQQVVTMTEPMNGLLTWIIFGVLFVFCIWPFCLIPFCVSSCRDVKHICPGCNNVIYVYKRM
ncbi:lipopolysaccharide-induced tumor necrosis factor-alpha factor homolog [Tachysurus vachellii]|uniref:lipopolysaccharide-induced tumor necrosis factor-alpha factor homolog n=1 Tax=Tachysurus vachellii TaxID=175792 RepID=UPI00296A9FC7|nr:lipopolysaccharide-induced tumor necrosis factor-alpha factor homolog [Tachysurus vachellii]